MSVQATLAASLTISDGIPGDQNAIKQYAAISAALSTIADVPNGSVGTSPFSPSIPNPTQVLVLQNTHATQTITVAWTPHGSTTETVVVLQPLSIVAFVESATGGGIDALSVTGSGAGTTYKMVAAG